MTEGFPSKAKPPPRFMPYAEAVKQAEIIIDATRQLCDALLTDEGMNPQTRSRVLALKAVLDARLDG